MEHVAPTNWGVGLPIMPTAFPHIIPLDSVESSDSTPPQSTNSLLFDEPGKSSVAKQGTYHQTPAPFPVPPLRDTSIPIDITSCSDILLSNLYPLPPLL